MFRHVPECSGMFRVPGFIDALKKWHFSLRVIKIRNTMRTLDRNGQ